MRARTTIIGHMGVARVIASGRSRRTSKVRKVVLRYGVRREVVAWIVPSKDRAISKCSRARPRAKRSRTGAR
jgi:hypothetical protein